MTMFFALGRVRAGVVIERDGFVWRFRGVVRLAPGTEQIGTGPLQLERGAAQLAGA